MLLAGVFAAGSLLAACQSEVGGTSSVQETSTVRKAPDEAAAMPEIRSTDAVKAPEKSELVHVDAEPDGTVKKVSVEATLKHPKETKTISDVSNLSDIMNKKGDEAWSLEGENTLYWQNAGADITYEGETDKTPPVQVKISGTLDGKEIKLQDLAGKSGEVGLRIDYENLTEETEKVDGKKVKVPVPFAVISMLMFPQDSVKDMKIENGKRISFGEEQMVMGYAMPGLSDALKIDGSEKTEDLDLPDHVEITLQTEDFSMDYAAHMVTNGLLADADLSMVDDMNDLADGIGELDDASEKLTDGMKELSEGSDKFGDALSAYVKGAKQLDSGAASLSQGLSALDSSVSKAKDKLETSLEDWNKKAKQLKKALSSLDPKKMKKQQAAYTKQLTEMSDTLTEEMQGIATSLKTASASLSQMEWDAANAEKLAKKQAEAALDKALNGQNLTKKEKAAVKKAFNKALSSSLDLSGAQAENAAAAQSTAKELGKIGKRMKTIQTALSGFKIDTGSGNDLQSSMKSFKNVSFDGMSTKDLTDQFDQLSDGIHKLSTGAKSLRSGTKQLASSGSELTGGYSKIEDGISELYKGIKKFDQEGIDELSKLSDKDTRTLLSRIKALQKADKGYQNFSGITPGTKGEVRFLIEMEGVS